MYEYLLCEYSAVGIYSVFLDSNEDRAYNVE